MLVGPPPQHPIPKPAEMTEAWQSQARRFANYFLILYRPWTILTANGGTLPGSTLWHDLCVYMQVLECGEHGNGPSYLNRIRSRWMTNAAHGLRIAGEDRTAANKYRCECATNWGAKDPSETLRSSQEPEEGPALLSNDCSIQSSHR